MDIVSYKTNQASPSLALCLRPERLFGRFVGLNRRGLVYIYAHLKKFSNAYSR